MIKIFQSKLINCTWLGAIAFLIYINPVTSYANEKYDLDEFDDLELEELKSYKNKTKKNSDKRLILFDDTLYLLDDEFDFGEDEIELEKLELNPDDMETFKEYEDFLNAFFENSSEVGTKAYGKTSKSSKPTKKAKKSVNKSSRKSKKVSKSSTPATFSPTGKLGFGVSTMLGTTIPMGENLTSNYSSGSNFGVRLDTPISFNLGNMEAKVGTELYFSTMNASVDGDAPYKLTNLVGNIGVFLFSSLEVRVGLGLTPATIGFDSKVIPSIPVDINYYLPFKAAGFRVALNLHAQETLGIPNDDGTGDTKGTSEFINVGLVINTPLVF